MSIAIKTDSFGGIQPRLDATALGDGQATVARNCRLHTTKVNPIRLSEPDSSFALRLEGGIASAANAQTIRIWDRGDVREVIGWGGLVTVAPSNIADDSRSRLFVSGATGLSDSDGDNQPCALISTPDGRTYDLHKIYLPAPPAASVTNNTAFESLDISNLRYTYFFQSFVDEYGYESGLSPVAENDKGETVEVQYNDGDTMTWDGIPADLIPDEVVARRLYKSVAGSGESSDAIRFVCEQNMVDGQFDKKVNVKVKDEDTGEISTSITSIPTDLVWMTMMPGGFYAGFRRGARKQICFSESGIPTSYPDAYRYSIRDNTVGIAVSGNTAFVLTDGTPWAISGTDPNGMTVSQVVSNQACVSERSICTMEGKVFYASQDGVCVMGEDSLNSTVITRGYWDKEGWSRLNPSSCLMVAYDNALFLWFKALDGGRDAYIIDFDTGGTPIITQHDDYARAAFVDAKSDKLYFVRA